MIVRRRREFCGKAAVAANAGVRSTVRSWVPGGPAHQAGRGPRASDLRGLAALVTMQTGHNGNHFNQPSGARTMKNILLGGLLATAVALPALAALKEGAPAPAFTAKASLAGKAFDYSLRDSLKKGPVVVYFYPSAFTQGCNIQAHTFSENMDKFTSAGASVIGVSLDSIERLNDFSADPNYCAGKVAVASDPSGAIAKSFDLNVGAARDGAKDTRGVDIGHGFAERTTFVVTPDGKVASTIGGISPAENVQKSLEAVQHLQHAGH
jgi:peroxiredoxin